MVLMYFYGLIESTSARASARPSLQSGVRESAVVLPLRGHVRSYNSDVVVIGGSQELSLMKLEIDAVCSQAHKPMTISSFIGLNLDRQ